MEGVLWLEITGLDSYYAGWALTVSEGGKISSQDFYNIDGLKKWLERIRCDYEEDKQILEECRSYLKIINQSDQILHKIVLP